MPAVPDHIPVLLDEILGVLKPADGEVYLDCTAGLGGHAAEIAVRLGSAGHILLCDRDASNLAQAGEHVRSMEAAPTVEMLHDGFDRAPARVEELGLRADVVLADLGFASNQVDDPNRGLSFKRDGPLDMRLDPSGGITAADMVRTASEEELANIIYRYGEERFSRRIARRIMETRDRTPIETTGQLADIVRSSIPRPRGGRGSPIDPATRTFQALRIAVNDEIGALERLLDSIREGAEGRAAGRRTWLSPGARIAIIAFHSLEDRPVKHAFAELAARGLAERLTRKPIRASEAERGLNPRARSAKLRAVRIV